MSTTRELAERDCVDMAKVLHDMCVIPGMSAASRLELRAKLASIVMGEPDLADDILMLSIEGPSGEYMSLGGADALAEVDEDD